MLLGEEAVVDGVAEVVESKGRGKSAKDIHKIVGTYIDRGAAQENVEGDEEAEIKAILVSPLYQHQDGGYAHVRGRESSCWAFPALVRHFDPTAENSVGAGQVHHSGVCGKVVAKVGKLAPHCGFNAQCVEIAMRTGHWHEDVDQVVEEERREYDESCAVARGECFPVVGGSLPAVEKRAQRAKYGYHYHGIVCPIAQMEEFAPYLAVQPLAEEQRGLATEKRLVGLGKQMVEIGKTATELVGLGIPHAEQCQGKKMPKQACPYIGPPAVNQDERGHHHENAEASGQYCHGVGHLRPEETDKEGGEYYI